ncbi:MAG TPA: alpha-glucan family phosphorylase [Candidatus Atribacteria bacterium]|nr:alpha-glucan family phosphorylase [Candidatus Atribacteria bacterium]
MSIYMFDKLKNEPIIAYLSMEIALSSDIPTYSGGLGVLAGDTVRSAADLSLPFVAVTLISRKGYLNQKISAEGWQIEQPVEWEIEKILTPLPVQVEVEIEKRKVKVGAWVYPWKSARGIIIPVIFLDTNIPQNAPEDRSITDYLYGGDSRYRLKQEIVLGIGGSRILKALDLEVRKYHINEGHAALVTIELLQSFKNWDVEAVKNLCVFTTHTPVEAGHDKFPYDLVKDVLGEPIPLSLLQQLGGIDCLNMTLLALNLSGYINGVAKKHREVSLHMFPGYDIHSITNGVHSFTWTSPTFQTLFDRYIPGWAQEPELLTRADIISNQEIWVAHQKEKTQLFQLVKEKNNIEMDEEVLTLGFARRMTAYKRPHLIFTDIERLKKINRAGKLQIVFAGKAHPYDFEGKKLIQQIIQYSRELSSEIKIAFLENYNLEVARKIVAGVDVWVNTPMKPLEASGTSGMKAAHNGVINFSVLDGWWIEGCLEGITGWSIGPGSEEEENPQETFQKEIDDFYGKLEYVIVPIYYHHREQWIKMMKNSISKIASYFNAHRMMESYITEAYFHQPFLPLSNGLMVKTE